MKDSNSVTLEFPEDWSERDFAEIQSKEWCGVACVRLPGGERRPVFFTTPLCMSQEMAAGTEDARPWLVEKNLIPVADVTLDIMKRAVQDAYRQGFFDD